MFDGTSLQNEQTYSIHTNGEWPDIDKSFYPRSDTYGSNSPTRTWMTPVSIFFGQPSFWLVFNDNQR